MFICVLVEIHKKSGGIRKDKLDEHVKDNEYICAFYAKHTFEVEFIGAENSIEGVKALDSIYRKRASIIKSSELLESSKVEVYGKEILRLAEKVGKGWLALLISEHVSSITYIPQYILDAIAFSCGYKLAPQILYKICCYRLKNPMPALSNEDKPIQFFKDNRTDINACIAEFSNQCPDDDLSYLISLME